MKLKLPKKLDLFVLWSLTIIVVFLFHFPLLNSGFPMSHDGTHHLIRSAHYFQLLKAGQILPYWDSFMNQGFGSPLFNYVPPLVYVISSFWQVVGTSVINSLKILVIVFNLIFIVGAYKAFRIFFDNKVSVLASILLFLSPYRISQVYVRGALPEFAALSLTPLFFFFLLKALNAKVKLFSSNMLWAAISLSAILLAHTLFAIQLALVLSIIVSILFFKKKYNEIIKIIIVGALAGLLASFLYLPLLFELGYVQVFLSDGFPPLHHFVAWWQFFDPGWGLGFSEPGTADGMSFQVGAFHWLLIATSFFYLVKDYLQKKKLNVIAVTALGIFLLSLFLQIDSPVTRYLYEEIIIFRRQQFPWRFLNISILSVSVFGTFALKKLKLTTVKIILLSGALFILSAYYLRSGAFITLSDQELLTYNSDTTFSHEYTPIGRDNTSEKEYVMTEPVYVISGAKLDSIHESPSVLSFNVSELAVDNRVRVNRLYFPGMKIMANEVEIVPHVLTKKDKKPDEGRDVTNLIELNVPADTTHVEVRYQPTHWRKVGSVISTITIILVVIGLYFTQKASSKR